VTAGEDEVRLSSRCGVLDSNIACFDCDMRFLLWETLMDI